MNKESLLQEIDNSSKIQNSLARSWLTTVFCLMFCQRAMSAFTPLSSSRSAILLSGDIFHPVETNVYFTLLLININNPAVKPLDILQEVDMVRWRGPCIVPLPHQLRWVQQTCQHKQCDIMFFLK